MPTPAPRQDVDDIAELFREVGRGSERVVAKILLYRPELSRCRDASALSVLQFARYMDQPDILHVLIEAGPPLDVFEAASIDHGDALEALLSQDAARARLYSGDGQTPLHVAAYFGCVGAIDALIKHGARIEAATRDLVAEMPLHRAVAAGRTDACRSLLRHGADPNARRRDRGTPLMAAAVANHRELVEMLMARNADVELHNDDGRTAADLAASAGHAELAARLRLAERFIDRAKV